MEREDDDVQSTTMRFDPDHHETTRTSCAGKMEWWKSQTTITKDRCPTCWLRANHCFCKKVEQKRSDLETLSSGCNFNILMYYHYLEIGRSANTAHLFQALCPDLTEEIIFCDLEKERQLIEDIANEYESQQPVTCVLYPSDNALFLSDWLAQRPIECKDKPIRLVALDGTYPMARRQLKYLQSCCDLKNVPLPLVKLDLKDGFCKSAIAGIMSQPGKDKICTFQAIVMAMRQLNISGALCDHLTNSLEDWLAHILKSKIKFGKNSVSKRAPLDNVDRSPAAYLANILKKQPPPLGENCKLASRHRNLDIVATTVTVDNNRDDSAGNVCSTVTRHDGGSTVLYQPQQEQQRQQQQQQPQYQEETFTVLVPSDRIINCNDCGKHYVVYSRGCECEKVGLEKTARFTVFSSCCCSQ